MSTPTTLQSNLVPIALSSDGSTYKNVVCKKAWGFSGTTPTNVEQTDCGPLVGLGSVEWTFSIDGILNSTPNGSTEMTLKDILDLWNNQTLTYVKALYPSNSGSAFYLQGSGYITKFDITNNVGNLIAFTATFSGQGTIDTSY